MKSLVQEHNTGRDRHFLSCARLIELWNKEKHFSTPSPSSPQSPTFYACVFLFTDVLRFLQVPRHALLSQDNTIEISKQMKLFFGF